jgi:phage protein D
MTDSPSTRTRVLPGDETYAPQISILIEQQVFPLHDVIELRVTLQKDELGGFSMVVANPFEIENDGIGKPGTFRHSDLTVLDMFKAVEIKMGYATGDLLVPMFIGEIQTLAPSFPSSGLPTLNVTGIDFLSRMRRAKPDAGTVKSWRQLPDHEIAGQIAHRHGLKLAADSATDSARKPIDNQRDVDDLTYLMSLAKRNDFEALVVLEGGASKAGTPALYFGKRRVPGEPGRVTEIQLTWGETLISFTPRMSIGRQVGKVTVRGWDATKKEKIEYTATFADLKASGKGPSGPELLEEKKIAKGERVVDWPVQSLAEAKARAIDWLAETANQFLTGTGETIGNPAIRPLTVVKLGGLGARYDGPYEVTKADHVYGANGYTTSFEVQRIKAGS